MLRTTHAGRKKGERLKTLAQAKAKEMLIDSLVSQRQVFHPETDRNLFKEMFIKLCSSSKVWLE